MLNSSTVENSQIQQDAQVLTNCTVPDSGTVEQDTMVKTIAQSNTDCYPHIQIDSDTHSIESEGTLLKSINTDSLSRPNSNKDSMSAQSPTRGRARTSRAVSRSEIRSKSAKSYRRHSTSTTRSKKDTVLPITISSTSTQVRSTDNEFSQGVKVGQSAIDQEVLKYRLSLKITI